MLTRQRKRLFCLYALPTLAIFIAFAILPFFYNIYLSFSNWNGFTKNIPLAGPVNYSQLFADPIAGKALVNNLKLFLIGLAATMTISLFFAVNITRRSLRERELYRIVFFFPNMLSIVIVALLWTFIFNPTFGLFNGLLKTLGLGFLARAWLGDIETVIGALSVPWSGCPWGIIWCSLSPHREYSAERFRVGFAGRRGPLATDDPYHHSIDLGDHSDFAGVLRGQRIQRHLYVGEHNHQRRARRASELLTTYMYKNAFLNSKFGYGAAIGICIFLILVASSLPFCA
jgi:N-acetylglucosamine transport system permease protein